MDEIALLRGDQTVTHQKAPLHFAVRMRQGRAYHESKLERQVGKLPGVVRHVESFVPHNLELFAVEKAEMLDVVMAAVRSSPASGMVTHVYTLKDPSGGLPPRSSVLGRSGALHDLMASYHSARDPGLFDALTDLPARGDWRLKIESLDDFNTGVLMRWSLTINRIIRRGRHDGYHQFSAGNLFSGIAPPAQSRPGADGPHHQCGPAHHRPAVQPRDPLTQPAGAGRAGGRGA